MDRKQQRKEQGFVNEQTKETRRYFWISFILVLIANLLAFQGGRFFAKGRFHYDLSLEADSMIPFLPWTVSIYLGCFVFWFLLYRLVARLPRQEADRFFCANLLGKAVSFLFFAFFPTILSRPELNGMTVWEKCLCLVYRIDAPDNLFPSLHCMISWLCWIGIRGNRNVPFVFRLAALSMAVAVCLVTLTTRQHVLLDVAGGVLLSEICYFCAGCRSILRGYSAFMDRVMSGTKQMKERLMV